MRSYTSLCPVPLASLALRINSHAPVLASLDAALDRKAQLDLVWPRWALWLLEDVLGGYASSAPVAVLFRRCCAGDPPTPDTWEKEVDAAKGLLELPVGPRALAAANVAWEAAWASWDGPRRADWAAAYAVQEGTASWPDMAEKLKQLLGEAT